MKKVVCKHESDMSGITIPAAVRDLLSTIYVPLFKRLCSQNRKLGHALAEDVASRAITYALVSVATGKVSCPNDVGGWFAISCTKNKNLGINAAKCKSNSKLLYVLDAPLTDSDNTRIDGFAAGSVGAMGWSHSDTVACVEALDDVDDGIDALAILNQVCRDHGYSRVTQEAYYLSEVEQLPGAEIADRLGIKANNVYQMVSRVKKALREWGRAHADLRVAA